MKRKISWPLPSRTRDGSKLYLYYFPWSYSCCWLNTISHLYSLSRVWCWSILVYLELSCQWDVLTGPQLPTVLGLCCCLSRRGLQSAPLQLDGDTLRGEDQGEDEKVLQFSHTGGSLPPPQCGRAGPEEPVSRLVPGQLSSAGQMSARPSKQFRGSGQISNLTGMVGSHFKTFHCRLYWRQ